MNRWKLIAAALVLLIPASFASSKPSTKGTVVDEGSFGIFQNGHRYATESFVIRQLPDASSSTSAQLRSDDPAVPTVAQSSELLLNPDGTLIRYEWRQDVAPRNSATVEVHDQLLSMHFVDQGKPGDQAFFLTSGSFILDDYFFIAREVLAWRYMASSCKPHANGDGCDLERTRFSILIPRRRVSDEVWVEMKGYDDTPFNGRPQHLRHLQMESNGVQWQLWLDGNMKLVRISVPEIKLEVLRQEK